MKALTWAPLSTDKTNWVYSDHHAEQESRCVGHLRGDFGAGAEFWTSWFDHNPSLNTAAFRTEFQNVVNGLRKKLLKTYSFMSKECRTGLPIEDDTYGFETESESYTYCLRCIAKRGGYHFYIYAYQKEE